MNFFEKRPMIMIVIGVTGISLSAIFVKYTDAPSVITAAYRLLWTVGLMTPVVIGNRNFRKELVSTSKKELALCAVSGIFLALHFTTWFESLNQTSVASSAAIVCTEVIWVSLGYFLFLKGRISRAAVGSIAITIGGSLMIALSDYTSGGNHLFGDALALAAAIFSSVYTLIGREARRTMSTTAYTYIVYVFCAAALCAASGIGGYHLNDYGMSPILVGFLLAVCSTLLGHSIFSWCLKFLSPSFVSASKLCEPVVASVFAIFLFGEIPAPLQIAGGIITIGGVFLYSRVESRKS